MRAGQIDPTKDATFVPGPGRVFVFGSNRAGKHGGGAAYTAHQLYGAVWGVGEGLQGASYAIPTKDTHLRSIMLEEVQAGVIRFLAVANTRRDLTFFVTRIGCGLAGHCDEDIAPLFKGAPPNVELPPLWPR